LRVLIEAASAGASASHGGDDADWRGRQTHSANAIVAMISDVEEAPRIIADYA
jgi:hypothetical protein